MEIVGNGCYLTSVKTVVLGALLSASACSSGDPCERAAARFTDALLHKAEPTPDLGTTKLLAERIQQVAAERCRADAWSEKATACNDPYCLAMFLDADQSGRLYKAIEELVGPRPTLRR
jgi:hypothetical protein